MSRYGNFSADDRRTKPINCFTPCTCMQGNKPIQPCLCTSWSIILVYNVQYTHCLMILIIIMPEGLTDLWVGCSEIWKPALPNFGVHLFLEHSSFIYSYCIHLNRSCTPNGTHIWSSAKEIHSYLRTVATPMHQMGVVTSANGKRLSVWGKTKAEDSLGLVLLLLCWSCLKYF